MLIKDLSSIKSEVDRLLAYSEVKEIEMQESENRVQQLLDSVGRLNFNISKIEQYRREMKTLEARYTNIKNKQEQLQSNNMELAGKYEETREMLEDLKGRTNSLAETESLLRAKNQELSTELKRKSYLSLEDPLGNGFRLKKRSTRKNE